MPHHASLEPQPNMLLLREVNRISAPFAPLRRWRPAPHAADWLTIRARTSRFHRAARLGLIPDSISASPICR